MTKQISIIFLLLSLSFITQTYPPAYLTTSMYCCGRLGDQVLLLSKLLYLEQHGIPYLYQSLPDLDREFALNKKMPLHYNAKQHAHNHQIYLSNEDQLLQPHNQTKPVLYVATIHSNLELNNALNSMYDLPVQFNPERGIFDYSIAHPWFAEKIRTLLTPVQQPKPGGPIPTDCISVAVHVRKGSADDPALASLQEYTTLPIKQRSFQGPNKGSADSIWPLKFPTEQFYTDQIVKLSELLDDQKLYVHIFTDDKNPEQIMHRFEHKIKKPNLTFGCSEKNSKGVDDLFQIINYDCLISGVSMFTFTAQLLGNHKIIIMPINGTWIGNILHMDEIKIIFPNRTEQNVTQFYYNKNNQTIKEVAYHALKK